MPFNVGSTELTVVLAIALITLGPNWLLGPASRSAVDPQLPALAHLRRVRKRSRAAGGPERWTGLSWTARRGT